MRFLPAPFRRPVYLLSFFGIAALLLAAVLGAFYTPYDPLSLSVDARLQGPSWDHWLGTDHFGRDLLSRLLVGAAVSFRVSLATVTVALVLGVTLGTAAGYFRGLADRIVSSIIDAFLAMPGILLALALIAVIGPGELGVIAALGIAYTPNVARVVRGNVLSLRETNFVETAQIFGHPHWYILWRHIVPHVGGPLTVLASAYFAQALLSESVLSFLGLGVPPPHPSWGGILAEGRRFIADAPWLTIYPGLLIMISLFCINLLGDALRDYLDPRFEPAS
ncbi:MAG TPA: ABC transporter permease [Woeseiaceae bacterium]|nr:ABC transporter permease [Woeseiaceae bacterium]